MLANLSGEFLNNFTEDFDNGTVTEDNGLWMGLFCPLLLALLTCLTVIGNGIILISFIMEPVLRKLDHAFIISLSVADFMVGLTVMPMYAVWVVKGEWPFMEVGCYLWQILDCMSSTASFWTLLAMAVDRYITIRQPFNKFSEGRRTRVIIFTIMVWLLPTLYWVPSLVAIPIVRGLDLIANCESTFKEFTLVTSIIIYNLPTLLMIVFYSLILYEVRKVKRSPNAAIDKENGNGKQGSEKYKESRGPVKLISIQHRPEDVAHNKCIRSETSSSSGSSGHSSVGTSVSNLSADSVGDRSTASVGSERKASNYATQMQQSRMLQEAKVRQKMQRHTVRMLGTIMACFLLCWLLWDINWPLAWYLPDNSIPEALHSVSCWLAYGNSAVNPFVYCFSNPIFLESIKRVLLCKSKRCCRH